MLINIRAKPGAKENNIQKIDGEHFVVSVKESPVQGRANAAIIKLLTGYFSVTLSDIAIISGRTSRNKIVRINR